jgi:hypothetical protein
VGHFEALNNVFIQSKPMRKSVPMMYICLYNSNKITHREVSNELNGSQNGVHMRKL